MPGDVYLSDYDYAAGMGYGWSSGSQQTQITTGGGGGGGAPANHTSFIIWTLVLLVGSVMILHGLRLGGFTFVFRR